MLSGLNIEKLKTVSQARRSKITGEVLVVMRTSQQRDVVQSYAYNLAEANGRAGIRMDIPDFLRGLFRQFETHAVNLKAKYGPIKRAIRFDDLCCSLYMDVKLVDSDWHRITAKEMKKIKPSNSTAPAPTANAAADKRRILLQDQNDQPTYHVASDDEDEFTTPNQQNNSS